jgi:hypothetical protein
MTWLLVLSGSKGFAMPKIISGALMYCMFRPQLSKIFTNENQNCFMQVHSQNRCSKLSLVSVQKVHSSVSLKPHLKRKEFATVILCEYLNWKFWSLVFLVALKYSPNHVCVFLIPVHICFVTLNDFLLCFLNTIDKNICMVIYCFLICQQCYF